MKRLPGFPPTMAVLAALVLLIGALCLFNASVGVTLVQLATLVVLAVTLVVLREYAADTKAISKATILQARAQNRPVLVLQVNFRGYGPEVQVLDEVSFRMLAGQLTDPLGIVNIGPGAAFDIRLDVTAADGAPVNFFVPYLTASGTYSLDVKQDRFTGKRGHETPLKITYRGTGGCFESSYTLVSLPSFDSEDEEEMRRHSQVFVKSLDVPEGVSHGKPEA